MESNNFNFPFEPYLIQRQFMTALYDAVENRKIGIFESPTGTGKSLSLICGSLTWLRENQRKAFNESLDIEVNPDDPPWLIESMKVQKREEALHARKVFETKLAKAREREDRALKEYTSGEGPNKRRKIEGTGSSKQPDPLREFELNDYDSDDDQATRSKFTGTQYDGVSKETMDFLIKHGLGTVTTQSESDDDVVYVGPKIFYCSRTHSQLSQFASELRKIQLPPVLQPLPGDSASSASNANDVSDSLRYLTLGSRKNLCIHPKISKLNSIAVINERCLDLQKTTTPKDQKCPHMPSPDDEPLVKKYRDHALSQIRDIEDLGKLGKRMNLCPYYASRTAVEASEIVTLPYNLLLQSSAREALKLTLKDNVIIIDEAHNLMDSICGTYSSSISFSQLLLAKQQLIAYLQKFRAKLSGKNRVYVTQLVRLLDSLIGFLNAKVEQKQSDGICTLRDLLAGKSVDQINLYKLNTYLQLSRLPRKVDGYTVFEEEHKKHNAGPGKQQQGPQTTMPVLMHFQSMITALMNPSKEGRFFFTTKDGEMNLSYMLLDPSSHFREIVEDARAVILAGGTMSPMEDYTNHLFSYLPVDRISTLSCRHIVPSSSLAVYPVSTGQKGVEFDFTFAKRNVEALVAASGAALVEFARCIPDGVVAFFPSYAYLDKCTSIWKRTPLLGTTKSIWHALQSTKPIFSESKGASTDAILSSFTNAVREPSSPHRGAVLLAIISGSLSEGINFSDELGRGVVVFGLPFPNPHTAEWKAKMEYIENKAGGGTTGKAAAREFYENATMRAVNQAVGRAIRHRSDYAAVMLVDRRYNTPRIRDKLPGWMKDSIRNQSVVAGVAKSLEMFFANQKQ